MPKAVEMVGIAVSWVPGFVGVYREPQELALCSDSLALESGEIGYSLCSPFSMGRISFHAGLLGLGVDGVNMNLSFLPSSKHLFLFLCFTQVLSSLI